MVSFADIEHWLLHEAAVERDMLLFFESFIWRLVAAGGTIARVSLHIGTLHPQLIGFGYNWNINDGLCDEVKVAEAATKSDSYKLNPLYRVFELGETVRRRPNTPEALAEFPMMAELAAAGMTDYVAIPLSGAGHRNAITIATKHPNGFSEAGEARFQHLLSLFALHVERYGAMRISGNALNAYLGQSASAKVLSGSIKRGSGESIHAVIWISDLRGFTDLSDRLSGSDMLTLLNAYFEAMAGAVLAHGGEVLKFIGDGLLAVFPVQGDDEITIAAKAAISAARQAIVGLDALNANAPAEFSDRTNWEQLRVGIALHEGEVFFGNIGSPDRLDFTVIGPAVNEASRVEALQKVLGRSILVTEAVARHLDCKMDHLGEHTLRGVATPISIYSPAEGHSPRELGLAAAGAPRG
ncbi:adenylate/guanylate cyclase domain-containing protein [Bradyrhizobium prioriisuperbiae]|uniref:adenylate/guanylate cyclase domain-containing protein n=1 Tax=Bradyrhizobium prioriisuperbiae TaxID=2854389 RepID=UPI0028E1E48D|nr:adenylate/guanylate cyclase domain-containing protein [Bradyrhizobium prioritasuperba]